MSGPRARAAHIGNSTPSDKSNGHHAKVTQPTSSTSWIWSPNPERARGEQLFLGWALVWVSLMAFIVATRWFETFTPWHYMVVGLLLVLAPIIIPILVPHYFLSAHLPLSRRYTTKANLYIFVLSWNANYFWTHYFYTVLAATYTFEAHRLNEVPFALYLITHSYFHLYHVLASILMRAIWRLTAGQSRIPALVIATVIVALSSYIVAFMETFTIQNFPYYDIPDRPAMYMYGSMFYAIYFCVSFPMFARLDEYSNSWTLTQSFIDSMACSMMITQGLDLWRISIGKVTSAKPANPPKLSVPFIY